MRIAITREVSPSIGSCELTHLSREPIDLALARAQHRAYQDRLRQSGCAVRRLPAEPDLPDSVFVEDAAVVLDELAILTRPGAAVRRGETASLATALRPHRRILHRLTGPATLDGGDVLRLGRTLYVGRSSRTNPAGIEQLGSLVEPYGYRVRPVAVNGCLHLKSAVTQVAEETLLIRPDWIDAEPFAPYRRIEAHPSEPLAANALLLDDGVVYPLHCHRTRRRMERHGLRVWGLDVSELAKAEGGVTCCSLIFRAP